MKSLNQYIIESSQTYDFKIKIAGIDINNDIMDRIEHALDTFDIVSLSKPKNLPIETKNLDFPSFPNVEVSLIIASLKYPCTDTQIRQAITQQARLPAANIVVIPKNQPEELMREKDAEDETKIIDKEPILTKELENVSGGQIQVGQKRVDSMLKELETRKNEFAAKGIPSEPETTNRLPMGTTSPVARNSHKPQGR